MNFSLISNLFQGSNQGCLWIHTCHSLPKIIICYVVSKNIGRNCFRCALRYVGWWGNEILESKRYILLSLLADRVVGYFKNEWIVALHLSTYDIQLFHIASQEVSPFLVLNLNLPLTERRDSQTGFLMCTVDTILTTFCLWGYVQGHHNQDSFLVPFLEELMLLNDGVCAYDAHREISFRT